MSAITIKVTTEELQAKADIVKVKVAQMQADINEAERLLNNTASYWLGDAGDKKRKDFQKKKQQADEVVRRLSEYPRDLLERAGIYVAAEKENASRPASLPTDFII